MARICDSTTQERNLPTAGSQISVPVRRSGSTDIQEMEQALVTSGASSTTWKGMAVAMRTSKLAKFLLDSRRGGQEYDQSHLPPGQQYEAVGHAVRATYFYSGMADIAAETGDKDYQSAVASLWDNMVNRQYYVNGGIGSGETSEGFGPGTTRFTQRSLPR